MTKWLKIDQNNLLTETAKAVARFMSFAKIACFCKHACQPSTVLQLLEFNV